MAEGSGNRSIPLNDATEMLVEPLQGTSHPVLGNEIVPLASQTQIALPATGDGSLVAPNQSEVVISGGNYDRAVFGPQTNKQVVKANNYSNAKITNIHHHHYAAMEGSRESPLTSNETGARPNQSQTLPSEEDVVQISDDLFMYSNQPLQEGTDVFKGYQLHASGNQRPLAIKRIVPCENSHLKEVQHLLTLASHPNVVQIIQSKEHGGYVRALFIAMELCSSKNLQDYLDKNREENIPFDFNQTMSFTKQLVSGMKHIHRNMIVHRDLKLKNILVSEDGEHIKISDFGLSKRLRLGKSQTQLTKLGVGTDGFRAPETFVSETIGRSADIFSLGATMYSMWSNGNHPFGEDPDLWNYKIKNNEGRDLSGLLISGTKEYQLRNLIDWMLRHDPKNRPTIEQVAQHPFFESGPSSAAEDPRNNASSIQQLRTTPSLRKPTNEDTVTEQSRSILHHRSATNIPFSTPDSTNSSNFSQLQVDKSSLIKSDNKKTLTGQFQSALRIPSASKELPFREGIVIFDNSSNHLQLFNPFDNTLKQMQSFDYDMKRFKFTVVSLHDFIYVLMNNKEVLRLGYFNERATWERIPDMIDDHGFSPPVTVMSDCIYVAGGRLNAVEKFYPSSNEWVPLLNNNLATMHNALVVVQDFIYSIGGVSGGHHLKEVERFDPVSPAWTFVAPMKQRRSAHAAVEFNGKIFVLGGWNGREDLSSVEIYDPSPNTWSAMKNNMLKCRNFFNACVINGNIYAVGGDSRFESIERCSSEKDVWREVQIQTERSIKIYNSTKIYI